MKTPEEYEYKKGKYDDEERTFFIRRHTRKRRRRALSHKHSHPAHSYSRTRRTPPTLSKGYEAYFSANIDAKTNLILTESEITHGVRYWRQLSLFLQLHPEILSLRLYRMEITKVEATSLVKALKYGKLETITFCDNSIGM